MTAELRIEQKIPLDAADLMELREWHTTRGKDFHECNPPRIVNSLYLDSPAMDDYSDNLDGVSVRRKLRLRWYGETVAPKALRIEIKTKRSGVSMKHLFLAATPPGFAGNLRATVRALRSLVPTEFRRDFDEASQPALWNRYRRQYYATRDGQRLTIDTHMLAADLPRDRLDQTRLRASDVHGVLELKYPVGTKDALARIVGTLPLRLAKHSKYVSGIGRGPC